MYSDINVHSPTKDPLVYGEASVMQSVFSILATRRTERLFRPTLGSDLENILFDNMSTLTEMQIRKESYDAVDEQEPRVILNSAKSVVTAIPEEQTYETKLVFSIEGIAFQNFEFIGELGDL